MEQNNEEKAVAVQPIQRSQVSTGDDGVLKPKTLDEAFRWASAVFKSGMLPQRFKTAEAVLTAAQMAMELGLKPLTALRQIAVINGTPSLFGDLPLSVCYASGKVESIKEFLLDKNSVEINSKNGNMNAEAWAAVTIVKRRGDPESIERFFSMDDAKQAGLLNSPTWKTYPKRMLQYRSRSQALKDKFPDALNGISIAEYDFNTIPEDEAPIQVTHSGSPTKAAIKEEALQKAQDLSERLKKPKNFAPGADNSHLEEPVQ
jgi:hypothetical protein